LQTTYCKFANNPWITPDILTAIKQKDKIILYAKYLKKRSSSSYANYKKCRNKLTHTKYKAKQKYFLNRFRELNNPSDTWKHINQILQKSKPTVAMPSTIKINRKAITAPKIICNEMNEHFVKIEEKLSIITTSTNVKGYIKFLGKRQVSYVYMQPTDEHEIIKIIACLSIRKSPGYIDIPIISINEAKFLLAPHLAKLFNECIKSGTYPDILKVAKVISLHNGGSKFDLNNYRPITILSPINKVFETILHRRLVEYWEKNNLFLQIPIWLS